MIDERKKGWLSPTGEFMQTSLYEHLAAARSIANKIGIGLTYKSRADDELLNRGWVSITLSEMFREWRIAWERPLTPEQIEFLKPYFDDYYPVDEMTKYYWERELEQ